MQFLLKVLKIIYESRLIHKLITSKFLSEKNYEQKKRIIFKNNPLFIKFYMLISYSFLMAFLIIISPLDNSTLAIYTDVPNLDKLYVSV